MIYAHENVRRRMSVEGSSSSALNARVPASPRVALPVVTFTDAVTFHINDDSMRVLHVRPAHTDGDAIIHFTKANVIHMGDVFHNAGLPFVDLSSGGSIHGIIDGRGQGAGAVERADEDHTRPRTAGRSGAAQGLSRHGGRRCAIACAR